MPEVVKLKRSHFLELQNYSIFECMKSNFLIFNFEGKSHAKYNGESIKVAQKLSKDTLLWYLCKCLKIWFDTCGELIICAYKAQIINDSGIALNMHGTVVVFITVNKTKILYCFNFMNGEIEKNSRYMTWPMCYGEK